MPRLAAVFTHGKMQIIDNAAFNLFKNKYEEDRHLLMQEYNEKIPSWNELVDLYQDRF